MERINILLKKDVVRLVMKRIRGPVGKKVLNTKLILRRRYFEIRDLPLKEAPKPTHTHPIEYLRKGLITFLPS